MYQWEKAEAEKKAREEGYKQSSTDQNKWIKDGKSFIMNDDSVKVNGTTYNTAYDVKNSKKW